MKELELGSWERREQFEFFSRIWQPFYSVSFRVDVTKVYDFAKKNAVSFYYAMTYLVTKALNSAPELRICVRDGELFVLDERIPSFTDMKKGSEAFYIVTLPAGDDILDFCERAKRKSSEQSSFLEQSEETDELIFISCLPWLDITSLTNERDFDPDDAIPRIAWGKYTEENGKKILGMSVEVNHRFCDGVHIGKFNAELCKLIYELK